MLNLAARIAKLVALLGFLLPWAVVSCSGTEIASATGVQLMTGDIQPAGPLQSAPPEETQADPSIAVIAAFAVIAAGLLVSFLLRGRNAAIALLVGAVVGAGTAAYSMQDMKSAAAERVAERGGEAPEALGGLISGDQQREFAEAVTSAIVVEEQSGYWVTLGALALAALLALLTLIGVRVSVAGRPPA